MRHLVLITLVCVLAAVAPSASNPEGPVFPELDGRNLQRHEVQLPQGFAGQANLVLFGFVRDHQDDIDTWIPQCERLEQEVEGFRFYEVPFLAGRYRLIRFWIDGGMRDGIPDQQARERTITVYGGRKAALKQLGVTDVRSIRAFLVTPSGEVLWRSEGRWSPEKDHALRNALDQALSIE